MVITSNTFDPLFLPRVLERISQRQQHPLAVENGTSREANFTSAVITGPLISGFDRLILASY